MKHTNICPKCGSKELEKELAVQSGGPFTLLYRGMLKDWVKVEAFICKKCGYCELWIPNKHMKFLEEEKEESL
jgi:predicted nucleic-acid-binding Zn-ribbon protein